MRKKKPIPDDLCTDEGNVPWAETGVDLTSWFNANGHPPEHLVQKELEKMRKRGLLPSVETDLFSTPEPLETVTHYR